MLLSQWCPSHLTLLIPIREEHSETTEMLMDKKGRIGDELYVRREEQRALTQAVVL